MILLLIKRQLSDSLKLLSSVPVVSKRTIIMIYICTTQSQFSALMNYICITQSQFSALNLQQFKQYACMIKPK